MALVNNNFKFRDILKRSYYIVIKNKFLWFFGFFAALFGVGGEFESLFNNYSNIGQKTDSILSVQNLYQTGVLWQAYENISNFFTSYPVQSFLFLLMVGVVFLVVIWMAIISQIALFDSANKISKNKKIGYSEAYHVGNKHFGSVLLVNILLRLSFFALFAVIAAPILSWFLVGGSALGGMVFVFLLFLIFIPISIIISFIVKYAIAYIVIKEEKVANSIKLGWELFKKNWIISIEMALFIFLIGTVVAIGMLIIIGLVSIPFILLGGFSLFFGASTGTFTGLSIIGILAIISWFIIVGVIGGAFIAYQYTAWTLLFNEIIGNKAESKIKRLFDKFLARKA